MRIETLSGMPVHVSALDETIKLEIGEASDAGRRVTMLSVSQAAMLLHALGLEIAQIGEQQRRAGEAQAHLAQVVADTEVRRR